MLPFTLHEYVNCKSFPYNVKNNGHASQYKQQLFHGNTTQNPLFNAYCQNGWKMNTLAPRKTAHCTHHSKTIERKFSSATLSKEISSATYYLHVDYILSHGFFLHVCTKIPLETLAKG